MRYKWIYFKETEDTGKTKRWLCKNKKSNDVLGLIYWYGPWRQYIFDPQSHCIFNRGCLEAIRHFLQTEMEKRKQ